MFSFMGNIASKVSTYDAVPCWTIFFVKFTFNECSNVLFNIILFHGIISTINSILLHFITHICIFYDCFSIHFEVRKKMVSKIPLIEYFSQPIEYKLRALKLIGALGCHWRMHRRILFQPSRCAIYRIAPKNL
eukprot:NODE_547_length_6185_cov_0.654124.p6 type:complete len:133 gc:universal NODE_547_length_6185_cov_0.654124:1728-1330(-)